MPDVYQPAVELLSADEAQLGLTLKLRRQIVYLQHHSLYYSRLLTASQVDWRQIDSLKDLQRLPLTTLASLISDQEQTPPLGTLMTCAEERLLRIYPTTIPTTIQVHGGRKAILNVGVSHRDATLWESIAARNLHAHGIRRGSRVVVSSPARTPETDSAILALERLGAVAIVAEMERLPAILESGPVDALLTTSACADGVDEVLRLWRRHRPDAPPIARCILGNLEDHSGMTQRASELPSEKSTTLAQDVSAHLLLGIPGMAPALFGSCGERNSLHSFAPDLVISELVEPNSGASVSWEDEAAGELVLTSVDRECMPLLRFRTGVPVRIHTRPCACGRTSYRISRITGP